MFTPFIGSELTAPMSKRKHQPFRQLVLFQTGSYLDFVHLSSRTDGVNQALKKSGRDFNHLVFWVDH